jgi:xanthine dehydrogenase accessory factor
MDWLAAVEGLRARRVTGVIVTLAAVRGHTPRNSGAKMVVSAVDVWGTVGGGNLEATAISQARTMILNHSPEPALVTLALDHQAPTEFGMQCCGGEVTMLLEPIPVVPSVAIFGMGHVGVELARILSRHDLELFMVDSRADMLNGDRLAGLSGGSARLNVRHAAVPESVFPDLPPGTHVMIMTHDHAEDIALCDAALRRPELASIGLIGSEMKWAQFRRRLTAEGHSAQELERITTPIGISGITAKEPAAIAVSAAAGLLQVLERPPALFPSARETVGLGHVRATKSGR